MKGWYKKDTNRPTPATHITLEQNTSERVELYQQVNNPQGKEIQLIWTPYILMTP